MLEFKEQLDKIENKGLKRELRTIAVLPGGYCMFQGKRMLNLSGNDYLGLATDIELKSKFMELLNANPEYLHFGSSSSRLLTGNTKLYDETESILKDLYNAQSALFFNSGYHANSGILPAITGKGDLILSDKLCHASIIDGVRLANADHIRYRHLDYKHLESILEKKRKNYKNVFIVSESVFSMDGDEANLKMMVSLKHKYNAILYVDEAHAVGVVGERGLGLSEFNGVMSDIDILIGTMGKALASVGAYAIFAKDIQQILINKARTLIFTTALPSINMAWSKFIIAQMPKFTLQRQSLQKLCSYVKEVMDIDTTRQSFIVPFIVGENKVAVQLAEHLQSLGFLIFPIRPPTVPTGTARLRLSLTANIQIEQMKEVIQLIKRDYNAIHMDPTK